MVELLTNIAVIMHDYDDGDDNDDDDNDEDPANPLQETMFRIGADVDGLWQTFQPGPFSEKQAQCFTLQFCQVAVRAAKWI